MTACIYKRSKYYQEATLDPFEIVEPIGYKFLSEGSEKRPPVKRNCG